VDILVNWLVQGGLFAAATAGVLRLVPRARTQARYYMLGAASVTVLALPIVPPLPGGAGAALALATGAPTAIATLPASWWTSTSFAAALWIAWIVSSSLRTIGGAVALRDAKRRCLPCPEEVERQLRCWGSTSREGRQARLMLSNDVQSAAVFGGRTPIIALAPALLERFPVADVDRILIHEWAHVQRRDDIAQLIDRGVRTIAGWHPAIWWIGRQLEHEREVACDEIAASRTGSAKEYASCLVALAAWRQNRDRGVPALTAVPASGLHRRVVRLLAARPTEFAPRCRPAVAAASLVVVAAFVAQIRVVTAMVTPAAESVIAARFVSAGLSPLVADTLRGAVVPSDSTEAQKLRARLDVMRVDVTSRGTLATSIEPTMVLTAALDAAMADRSHTMSIAPDADTRAELPDAGAHARLSARSPLRSGALPIVQERRPVLRDETSTPWGAAANRGVAMARGSQNAAVKTAGAFSRFGKRIAASF
jgi:beta-lactamase regulating signal transducer with metallopeptidase domain